MSKGSFGSQISDFSGKSNPNWLYIPTPVEDSDRGEYSSIESFVERCRDQNIQSLRTLLCVRDFDPEDAKLKIDWADVIYVSGGNTLFAIKRWREVGLDILLRKARDAGKIMCGHSAGMLCWFESGHSDSLEYYAKKKSPQCLW